MMNYIDHASVKRETTELCHSLEKSQMSYAEPKTPNSKGTAHCSILSDILEDPKLEGTLNIEQTLLVLGVGDRDQRQKKEALESDKNHFCFDLCCGCRRMAAESSKYAELCANNDELYCLHIKKSSQRQLPLCQKSLSSQGFIETIFSPITLRTK